MTAHIASLWRRTTDWTAFEAPKSRPNAG
jgi:hypothetical protein